MRYLDIVRWGLAIVLLLFGLLSHDPESNTRWLALTLSFYGLPLLAQIVPQTWVRVYGLSFGGFVLAQAILSTYIAPHTYIVRPPNLNLVVDVVGDNLRGISGRQRLTTDSRGFRVTKPIDYSDDSSYRIFFVGASTVAQEWIDDRRTFPHLVQESLSAVFDENVESINTAVQGTRAVHLLSTMREVADLNPDMYVIVPGANDWGLQIVTHFDADSPEQFAHTTVHVGGPSLFRIPHFEFLRNYTLEHSLLGRVIQRVWTQAKSRFTSPESLAAEPTVQFDPTAAFYAYHRGSLFREDQRVFRPDQVAPTYAETYDEMIQFCEDSPATCVFTTHPHSFKPGISREYEKRFWMTPAFEDYTLDFDSMAHIADLYNGFTKDMHAEKSSHVCDLESQVDPTLENFYDEMHFNLAGSRRAAEVLHPCLRDVIANQLDATGLRE